MKRSWKITVPLCAIALFCGLLSGWCSKPAWLWARSPVHEFELSDNDLLAMSLVTCQCNGDPDLAWMENKLIPRLKKSKLIIETASNQYRLTSKQSTDGWGGGSGVITDFGWSTTDEYSEMYCLTPEYFGTMLKRTKANRKGNSNDYEIAVRQAISPAGVTTNQLLRISKEKTGSRIACRVLRGME